MPPSDGSPGVSELALVTTLFAALTAVLTYPLSIHPGSVSFGSDPDVHTFTWTLAWDVHALTSGLWSIFDANIFYPYDRTLAFSENLIGSTLVAAPVQWITGNPVATLNGVSLVSCVLCGLGAYVLGRRLGLGVAASIVCGVVFAFSPARFFRFGQTHLTTIQWIPLALASLIAYLDGAGSRHLKLAAGFATLQVFSSGHGAVYLFMAVSIVIGHAMLTRGPGIVFTALRDLGFAGALILSPTLLLVPPYLQVQRELGLRRTLENWAPSVESFLASPTHAHTWLTSLVTSTPLAERASAFMFPGYLPLVLTVVALVRLPFREWRRPTVVFAAITLVAVLLSAGPPIGLWPLVYWLPGFNFIRIPSRFILLAVLGIAALAGIGFHIATRGLVGRARPAAALLAVVVLVGEFAWIPLPVTPYRVEIPSIDRWLDGQPKPFAIAEVPVRPLVRYHSTYMLHSMAHWQRTVHGHSSLVTPLHEKLYEELRTFPDKASLEHLRGLGVDFVVVHVGFYGPEEWDLVKEQFERHSSSLELRYEDDSGRVYALK